jgi:hypothetical protein
MCVSLESSQSLVGRRRLSVTSDMLDLAFKALLWSAISNFGTRRGENYVRTIHRSGPSGSRLRSR